VILHGAQLDSKGPFFLPSIYLYPPFTDTLPISLFIAFASIAIWSSIPLTFRLFLTIKRRRGLYFYAILITTWGLSAREVGYMLTILAGNPFWPLGDILAQVCWVMMVTGFAVMLWSRLNLILESRRIRRFLLFMIIINAVVWHSMMITLSFGRITLMNQRRFEERAKWTRVYLPMERVHMIFFNGQEILLSLFYIRCAYQYLQQRLTPDDKVRSAMLLLLSVQEIVVIIDVGMITIDFLGY
jgi:hypothetical protein